MKQNKHRKVFVSQTAASAICAGIGVAVILSAALSAVLTSLVLNGNLQETQTGIGIFVIRALSVFSGSIIGSMIGKEKHLQTIGAITGCYLMILLALGIVLYDGSFRNFGIGIISTLIGGLGAYLIQMRPKKNRKITAKYVH